MGQQGAPHAAALVPSMAAGPARWAVTPRGPRPPPGRSAGGAAAQGLPRGSDSDGGGCEQGVPRAGAGQSGEGQYRGAGKARRGGPGRAL